MKMENLKLITKRMQSHLQLYLLPAKCYFLNLKEAWCEGASERRAHVEAPREEIKPTIPKLDSRGIVVIPANFDFSSLSEADKSALSTLIASGRVIEVKDLHSISSIQ